MSEYLWEMTVDGLTCTLPVERQKQLKIIYQEIANEILTIINEQTFSFAELGEVIQREEVLNLILLSFSLDIDLLGDASLPELEAELKAAYINSVARTYFTSYKSLIAQI